mgnify:CR=1 FL=1
MALNTLDFNSKLSGELDKVLIQKAETSFLADNAMRAKFVGTRNVLIPDLDMQGLGDYDRDDGFNKGSITVDQKSYTLTMDRAVPSSLTARTRTKPAWRIWPGRSLASSFGRRLPLRWTPMFCLSWLPLPSPILIP